MLVNFELHYSKNVRMHSRQQEWAQSQS